MKAQKINEQVPAPKFNKWHQLHIERAELRLAIENMNAERAQMEANIARLLAQRMALEVELTKLEWEYENELNANSCGIDAVPTPRAYEFHEKPVPTQPVPPATKVKPGPKKGATAPANGKGKKGGMTPEGRQAIRDAQKARWAAKRAEQAQANQAAESPTPEESSPEIPNPVKEVLNEE